MRIAILSDIHANRYALEAVLKDAEALKVDRCWFLGDAVGYGPHPVEPLLWLKEHVNVEAWVLGNHDAMLAGLLTQAEWEAVNHTPRDALALNRQALAQSPEADAFWQAEFTRARIPAKTHHLDGVDYLLVHSRPEEPLGISRYIYSWQTDIYLETECRRLFSEIQENGCPRVQCYGHTHIPTLVKGRSGAEEQLDIEAVMILPGQTYPLDEEMILLNPGSVGQPRDQDRRAAYAILDTDARTISFLRVSYPWRKTARDMQVQRYPDPLVRRLIDAPPPSDTPPNWLDHFERAKMVALEAIP